MVRRHAVRLTETFRMTTSQTHRKKLANLGIHNEIQPCDPDKVVFNYSSYNIEPRTKFLLAFGLDFCLPVFKLDYFKFFLAFERLAMNLKNVATSNRPEFLGNLQSLTYRHFYGFKPYKIFSSVFKPRDFRLLRDLAMNKDLVICKPDKGRGVVLVDRNRYISSMLALISDPSKFVEITSPISKTILKIEDQINNFIRKLKDSSALASETFSKLHVSGSCPGILYGLPKIHKPDFASKFQFRPIFAAYNTPSFNIAKFLVPILNCLTTNQFTVDNTFFFVDRLKDFTDVQHLTMASFDVENLFTNIPLTETIEICLNSLFKDANDLVIGLNRSLFKKLLELSVMNSFFIFAGKLYKQIDGLGMGLPLGPTLANIFMCFHEVSWLADCPLEYKPIFYNRYIDDTFLIFKHPSHAGLFFDYLNLKHPSIKFTMELESNNSLSFLDCKVTKSGGRFQTSVYRKPTFTGLGMSFFSCCSFRFKLNSLQTLIYRGYRVCSTFHDMHLEFEFLRNIFQLNGFPSCLVFSKIKRFLSNKFSETVTECDSKKTIYCTLPYFGSASETMSRELKILFMKYFPNINLHVLLVNNFKIGSFFRYKDVIPAPMRSNLVYEFSCARCASAYVGMTTRNFYIRVSEHRGRSYRSNLLLGKPPHSSVRLHAEQCDVAVSESDFRILGSTSGCSDLRILESLHIFKRKPCLNNAFSSYPLEIVNR